MSKDWTETAAGTTAGATATHAATVNTVHVITRISGHTDTTSIVQALDGSDAVLEEFRVAPYLFNIACKIPAPVGVAVKGKIVSSTADCQVNLEGESQPAYVS